MVAAYLGDLGLTGGVRLLEIGCGTGAIARVLAAWPGVGEVVGVDPSPILLARAQELGEGIANLSFEQGDGRRPLLPDAAFDAVVLHRVLSHVPDPDAVLAEAHRVMGGGGQLAVFDGDYATITLATGDNDPVQTCVDAFRPAYITNPLARSPVAGSRSRLPASPPAGCAATATYRSRTRTTCSASPTAEPTRSAPPARSERSSPPR